MDYVPSRDADMVVPKIIIFRIAVFFVCGIQSGPRRGYFPLKLRKVSQTLCNIRSDEFRDFDALVFWEVGEFARKKFAI